MYRELTVAHVRDSEEDDHVEVRFLESARIYTLSREQPDFDEVLALLAPDRPVTVGLASLDADVIEEVRSGPP